MFSGENDWNLRYGIRRIFVRQIFRKRVSTVVGVNAYGGTTVGEPPGTPRQQYEPYRRDDLPSTVLLKSISPPESWVDVTHKRHRPKPKAQPKMWHEGSRKQHKPSWNKTKAKNGKAFQDLDGIKWDSLLMNLLSQLTRFARFITILVLKILIAILKIILGELLNSKSTRSFYRSRSGWSNLVYN